MKKNKSALPRSFSNTTMSNATTHMRSKGRSVRMSGRLKGPTRHVNTESISRFCARYPARNKTMTILAISPGWNEKTPPMFSQMRLP